MSAELKRDEETRTTTLVWTFPKPMDECDRHLLARLMARTIGLGYTVLRCETDQAITLTAVLTAPRTQPFTKIRDLVPGAVVTAVLGEQTALET